MVNMMAYYRPERVIDLSACSSTSSKSPIMDAFRLAATLVPERFVFSLGHHIQFAREFHKEETRHLYIRIKLTAIRLAMCFSWTKKEVKYAHIIHIHTVVAIFSVFLRSFLLFVYLNLLFCFSSPVSPKTFQGEPTPHRDASRCSAEQPPSSA